ncbi:argininosuccinate lyase [bacterium]|nr:argininosuccinate lyase [bacterium]
MKLWQKKTKLNPRIEAFTVGDDPVLDMKLVKYDCRASIAHAKMLEKAGILDPNESKQIESALKKIIELHDSGHFIIEKDQEDCHTAIENHLTESLGELGKKIHTARSRNDQVLAALRLYYLDEISRIESAIHDFLRAMHDLLKRHGSIQIPGFTHTRKAMVSSVALWAAGYAESMADNLRLVHTSRDLMDQSPMGTGAGYGIPLDIDREYAAALAGFSRIQQHATYVQLSRGKLESTLVHTLTQVMLDLNRLASDLILFSEPTFGFFILPADFCTGSSIMPQKKNPDVLELVRAHYHRILANEIQLKTQTGNLISGYHRDMQTTKKPVMESLDLTLNSIAIMTLVAETLDVDKEKCAAGLTPELFATERVYELVRQGMPFRDAYRKIGGEFE